MYTCLRNTLMCSEQYQAIIQSKLISIMGIAQAARHMAISVGYDYTRKHQMPEHIIINNWM
jgi:hypothetical protein